MKDKENLQDTDVEANIEPQEEAEKENQEQGFNETGTAEEKSAKEAEYNKKAGKKNKKKDPKDVIIEELTDKNKRQLAEFDNFRKRTEKEKTMMYEIGVKDMIETILPVVDNFERGFDSLSEEERAMPFAKGMDRVYEQLMKALEEKGVKAIAALGQQFDPDFHNAVMHVEDEEAGENIVTEEFQKGYLYRDTVVRHSMVKVAN